MHVAPHRTRNIIAIILLILGAAILLASLTGVFVGMNSAKPDQQFLARAGSFAVGLAVTLTGLGLLPGRPAEAAPTERTRSPLSNLGLLIASLLITLLVCEVTVRLLGTTDESGQFSFMDQPTRPFVLPLDQAEETLNLYFATENSYILYDPDLGWTPRPLGEDRDGKHRANAATIRSNREYSLKPQPGVLRIALFGDSYTHSSNVAFEDTWGYQLEGMLRDRGIEAEVLNFGVPAYGMDQAYLRWQRDGRPYDPDIVIFGFRAPDAYRNVNLFRVLYIPKTGSPFSKPRFALERDGSLRVVNQPTVPPEEILDTLKHFNDSPLAQYDYWFDDAYKQHWWLNSKLVAVVETLILDRGRNEDKGSSEFYGLDHEGGQLALAIVDSFAAEVEASGSEFMVVTLPDQEDLKDVDAGKPLVYADLLQAIDDGHRVAHSENAFDLSGDLERYFGGHYSPLGNQVIAEAALDQVLEILDSGAVDTSHP